MFPTAEVFRFDPELQTGPILVYGAAHAGKSQWTEQVLPAQARVVVLGTADPLEPAFAFRLQALKDGRPETWKSIDTVQKLLRDLSQYASEADALVVDSMNQWLAAEMLDMAPGLTVEQLYGRVREHYRSFIKHITNDATLSRKLIIITSEVASGIAPQEPTARIFRQSMAEMNLSLAKACKSIVQIELGVPRLIR